MTIQEQIKYWIEASELDYKAMNNLYKSSDFVWALFLGHLVIEKLLKGLLVKNGIEAVPRLHDLNKLSKGSGLVIDEPLKDLLDVITSFNLEARYPDYKKDFYKKCNAEFCLNYIKRIRELR